MNKELKEYLEFLDMYGLDIVPDVEFEKVSKNKSAVSNKSKWLKTTLIPKRTVYTKMEEKTAVNFDAQLDFNNYNSFDSIASLSEVARNCSKCVLSKLRKNVVIGEGTVDARLMFIGEAPGEKEDETGRPFVGRAGQLLTKIIEAMHLSREAVYIANIVKCRPPGNRNPKDDEVESCIHYLLSQINIIRPQVIVLLGAVALKSLFNNKKLSISMLRGKFINWNGIKLMPTFHPAYLLRNPSDKKLVWEDMKLVMKELGIKL